MFIVIHFLSSNHLELLWKYIFVTDVVWAANIWEDADLEHFWVTFSFFLLHSLHPYNGNTLIFTGNKIHHLIRWDNKRNQEFSVIFLYFFVTFIESQNVFHPVLAMWNPACSRLMAKIQDKKRDEKRPALTFFCCHL